MKNLVIVIMIAAILGAFYEQTKAAPNLYIVIGCIVIFMYGMMRLSAKTPSKNQDKEEDNVE